MKIRKRLIAWIMVAIMVFGLLPMNVWAAAGKNVYPLNAGKTYTEYDFTGDGKKDTFKWVSKRNSGIETAYIYLNGKYKNKIDLNRGGRREDGGDGLYLVKVDKSRVFLMTTIGGVGRVDCAAYKYKSGKFVRIYKSFSKDGFGYVWPHKVVGNTIYMTVMPYAKWHDLIANEEFVYYAKYSVKGSSIKLASKKISISKTFRANATFVTSSTEKLKDAKGVKIYTGDIVKAKKMYNNAIQLSINGKTGWININGNDVYGTKIKGALSLV